MPPSTESATATSWRLEHTYAGLPEMFHAPVQPTAVARPHLVILNRALALSLGLDPEELQRPEAAAFFTGNELPPGARPLAQAYAGHQFGNFTMLGDGRAILLGEQRAPDGRLFDLQLKGPGPTPYSRRGDGRAALGPMLREYVISEAMHALGIPTTRSLAVAVTGEPVFREEPLQGAVLTRVAASHLRVGTFEYAAARGEPEALRALADYTIDRHYPDLSGADNAYAALLEAVMDRQVDLVARWLGVGFVHGVMNTDNMALSGETIDYGPCAFMDTYDPSTVFSSIDRHGRYAFGRQPAIAQWNLARLAETLLPLIAADPAQAEEQATAILSTFPDRFAQRWHQVFRSKLGLFNEEPGDPGLITDLLAWMQRTRADYTHTLRRLAEAVEHPTAVTAEAGFAAWHAHWKARLARQSESPAEAASLIRRTSPAVIPRNHRVEEALTAATRNADLRPFHQLLAALSRPYDSAGADASLAEPPPGGLERYRTYCGT